MRFPKTAFLALAAPLLLSTAYAAGRGGGGHAGGGRVGGVVRSGPVGGGFRGGAVAVGPRRVYSGYYAPRAYFGFGGWSYPYYYGSYGYGPYYYGYDPYLYGGYPPPPAVVYSQGDQGYPPQQQPVPPQTQPQASAQSGQTQRYYLIAFTDHSIQAATAYKVEDDQIHWKTLEGQEKQAPLSSVDVGLSQQLNRERQIEFPIP